MVLSLLLLSAAGHKLNRARLVAVTCWYWAVMTTLFACSSATWQGSILWALNGLGLGVMVPNAQSLIADYYDAMHRGRAFGMLLAVGE
jgi:MFS family permease